MVVGLTPKTELSVHVNQRLIRDPTPDPRESLIAFLRRHGLTGTKLGCAEGGCGSCTVVVSSFDYQTRTIRHESLNACLTPACAVHMKHVVTIEGIGSVKNLHPAQSAIALNHGSQCGFCTPGIVMSLYAELKTNPAATEHDIEEAFDGNLCRCTGYRPILDGAKTNKKQKVIKSATNSDLSAHDVPFPMDLHAWHLARSKAEAYVFENSAYNWFHPTSLTELLDILDAFPAAKLIHGNTEVGIEVRFKNQNYHVHVDMSEMHELKQTVRSSKGVSFGAATTLSSLQTQLTAFVSSSGEPTQTRGFKALLDNIKYFAGRQVRNVSSIGGNICTASPISDLNPVWVAMDSVLTVRSKANGERSIPMRQFFLGYRKTALQPGEVVVSIFVPYTTPLQFVLAYKQAKRRDDDIAIVNAALSVTLERHGSQFIVHDGCFAFGGMGIAHKTLAQIRGKVWSRALMDEMSPKLLEDMPLTATAPGGQIEYRKTLAQSFVAKFVMSVCSDLSADAKSLSLDVREMSVLQPIERGISSGIQVFAESKGPGSVGKSVQHVSALKQVTGEAEYIDDMPPLHNELHGAIVGSSIARGLIKSVDATAALRAPGVVDYISYKDTAGPHGHGMHQDKHDPNIIGPVFKDEELFATREVVHVGQMIGMIVAKTEAQARAAAKLVKIEYEQQQQPIITIEASDAIAANSFFPIERRINSGVFASTPPARITPLSAAEHFVEGTTRMSAQEHFYLETQGSLVVPGKEDDEYEIFSSTQNPTETQHLVAHVLGIASNRIVCRVKRMGGGFGGKETRSVFISCALAVAARKLRVPVRCILTREEDMAISGTRHPFAANYKIGFTSQGKLISAEIDVFSNGGFSMDLSLPIVERCLTHLDNTYSIPNMKTYGRICKTNMPTNTAFRGFGGPQGMMIMEQCITHVAEYLGKPVEDIRRMNLYTNGEMTHFNTPIEDVYLERAWQEIVASSDFENRKRAVKAYNQANKYRKRGITIMPTKFGLAFTARHLNQAGALVHVYSDGSVRLAHGGTEMGQGLHTKMIQIAADAFGVPISDIFVSETRTDTVANTSATAASLSSDLNGMAVLAACQQIMERLKPLRDQHPSLSWKEIVNKAYFERINLSANGFYATPDLAFDWTTLQGRMFSYFTYGIAVTEVEIDCLTGDHVVLRSDLIMDIGRPINPAIDVGQIEGAFTQGLGWCTLEEQLVSPTSGVLLTRGPGLYKIPGFKDIPVDFRVTVMDGVRNSRAIHSSKAVGEPPLFLGASVLFAVRDAVRAARAEQQLASGGSGEVAAVPYFRLDSPATSERIRLACTDAFVEAARTPLKEGEKPWSVAA
ncbi:molybdopterin binding aldehyde oxidase/xanthine dehydrogenase [Entophlyctis helioformis]|nr:molybdopterin binding aldehyde oxidase/xanthine dehydrogenase [Entophlyctis helioformis]